MSGNILILMLIISLLTAAPLNAVMESPAANGEIPHQNQGAAPDSELQESLASVREQSDLIKSSLENDLLTQSDMNRKAEELYQLWEDALNALWPELESALPEDEFAALEEDQRAWLENRKLQSEEAGKEVEGGSLYPLVVFGEASKLTEERVYELYELLKARN